MASYFNNRRVHPRERAQLDSRYRRRHESRMIALTELELCMDEQLARIVAQSSDKGDTWLTGRRIGQTHSPCPSPSTHDFEYRR